MAPLECPHRGCTYTTDDSAAMIGHRRNTHKALVGPANYTDGTSTADAPHPRDAQDPLERIAWMVNQIRIIAIAWVALTGLGALAWLIASIGSPTN